MTQRITLATITEDAVADLHLVIKRDMLIKDFAAKHRYSRDIVRRLRDELEMTTDAVEAGAYEPWENSVMAAMIQYQKEVLALDTEVDEIDVHLPAQPSLIIYMSDLHMGHVKSDHEQIIMDCEWIKNTPDVYVVFGGDLIDNVNIMTAMRGSFHENISAVDIQKYYMDDMVAYLGKEKILGMILGNHDEWSMQSDAFNPIKYVSDKYGIPYMGAFGFINAWAGDERYRMLIGHQFRTGNSKLNLTLAAKRFWEEHGDSDTDATFLGHRHEGASEFAPKQQGRERLFAQAGSYQISSRYSQRKSFGKTSPKMPGLVVFPDKHHLIPVHHSFMDGEATLHGAIATWQARQK